MYASDVAGLSYETYSAENGLVLKADGYSEKLYLVVDKVTSEMNKFLERVTAAIFETYKKQLSKNYYNTIIKPKTLNKDIRLQVIENIRYTTYEKYNLIDSLKLDDLKEFGRQFISELKIFAHIQGNVSRENAIELMETVMKKIPCKPIVDPTPIYRRTVKLPGGENYIRVRSMNPKDANTVITNYYQVGPSTIKLTAMLDLLVMLMEEPLFDQVRTKEQYGYDVGCSVRDNYSILGFSIVINSQETKFTADQVERRIEQFRREFLELLTNMSSIEFDKNRESLIKLNLVEDHRLKDEMSRNWAEITTEEYIFDRREREVQELRQLNQTDFTAFYRNLLDNSDDFRKLSVQVIGTDQQAVGSTDGGELDVMEIPKMFSLKFVESYANEINNVTDLFTFKKPLDVYPVTKTTYEDVIVDKTIV